MLWNIIYFLIAKGGGSDLFPIYLTREERENSFLIFWNMLPTNLIVITTILLLIYLIYIFIIANRNVKIEEKTQSDKEDKSKIIKSQSAIWINIGVFF